MGDGAENHWDSVRKLINKLMRECLCDAIEMAEEDPHKHAIPYSETAYLAGKLFDARWQAIVHDTDAGLFQ